jgi:hypothetical protein
MLYSMLVMLVGFTLLYVYMMIQKYRIETVRDMLADRELNAMLTAPAIERRIVSPVAREITGASGAED